MNNSPVIENLYSEHLAEIYQNNCKILYEQGEDGDDLYCKIENRVVAMPLNSFLLLGWYVHNTFQGYNIPYAANFYLHKSTRQLIMLPDWGDIPDFIAMPIDKSVDDIFKLLKQKVKYGEAEAYPGEYRKYKIEQIIKD